MAKDSKRILRKAPDRVEPVKAEPVVPFKPADFKIPRKLTHGRTQLAPGETDEATRLTAVEAFISWSPSTAQYGFQAGPFQENHLRALIEGPWSHLTEAQQKKFRDVIGKRWVTLHIRVPVGTHWVDSVPVAPQNFIRESFLQFLEKKSRRASHHEKEWVGHIELISHVPLWHPGQVQKTTDRHVKDDEPSLPKLDPLAAIKTLAHELIDRLWTDDDIKLLDKIIMTARQSRPVAKEQFVSLVNFVLETTSHRIQLPNGTSARLCVNPGSSGAGFIQFQPAKGGSGGGHFSDPNQTPITISPFKYGVTTINKV